jgi:hypothetical protein
LSLLARACGISEFEAPGIGASLPTTEEIEALFRAAARRAPFPGAGADVDLHGRIRGTNSYIRCGLHSGTAPGQPFVDHYNADFGDSGLRLSREAFKRAVEVMRPFEAFLAELNNEEALDAYTRQQKVGFKVPAIIRSLHYFDKDLASHLGGIDRCLQAPAARVERFLDGILIELVAEAFDPGSAAHVDAQRRAMTHLGMLASPSGGDPETAARG